jgi:hypothetical protein
MDGWLASLPILKRYWPAGTFTVSIAGYIYGSEEPNLLFRSINIET